MSKKRYGLTTEHKAAIVRRHLVEQAPMADLAEELGIVPTQYYRWQ